MEPRACCNRHSTPVERWRPVSLNCWESQDPCLGFFFSLIAKSPPRIYSTENKTLQAHFPSRLVNKLLKRFHWIVRLAKHTYIYVYMCMHIMYLCICTHPYVSKIPLKSRKLATKTASQSKQLRGPLEGYDPPVEKRSSRRCYSVRLLAGDTLAPAWSGFRSPT